MEGDARMSVHACVQKIVIFIYNYYYIFRYRIIMKFIIINFNFARKNKI